MNLTLAFGYKDNLVEDVHFLARQWTKNPKIIMVGGTRAKEMLIERTSALFVDESAVLVLSDPSRKFIDEVKGLLEMLKEKMNVIVYATSPDFDLPAALGAVKITMEKEKEKRIREKVRSAMKADGKKMTEKALALLQERVRDEALLEEELSKLMNYTVDKKVIDVKDVAAVVTEVREEDFITLADALARRNRKDVLTILETLLSQGMNILVIQSFMARHVRLLLQAKDAEEVLSSDADYRSFAKSFGSLKEMLDFTPEETKHYLAYQKPFYAYRLSKTSRKFSKETLISFIEMLAAFDLAVKRGTRHERNRLETGLLGV